MLGMFILVLSMVMVACGDDTKNKEDNNAEPNNEVADNNEANNNEANNDEEANNEVGNEEGNLNAGETAEGETGFEDLIAYLDAMDLEPGEPVEQDPAISESLGAEKGIILPIADIDVQFFLYDENGEFFNQEQYDQASSDDEVTVDIGGGETFEIPILINDDLGLALYEDHYMKDELVEAFTNY